MSLGAESKLNVFYVDKVETADVPLVVDIRDAKGKRIDNNIFRVQSIQGQESLSQPFEFSVELTANDSLPDGSGEKLSFDSLLGKSITLSYVLPVPQNTSEESNNSIVSKNSEQAVPKRYFNGIIADFSLSAPGSYHLTVKPRLWLASLTNRYQLYSAKSIQAVLQSILEDHEIVHEMHLDSVAVNREQDWIQTGETDLDFIQRLMHKANIYYYFSHEDGNHTLIIANNPYYKTLYKEGSKEQLVLRYVHSTEADLHSQEDEHLSNYTYKKSVSCSGVHSILLRSEAAWESDNLASFTKYEAVNNDTIRLPFRRYKIFQYGGSSEEVNTEGSKNWEMIQSAATSLNGESSSPLLSAGHTFVTMNDAQFDSPSYEFGSDNINQTTTVRPELEGCEFVVTQVQHKLSAVEPYSNSFQATQSDMLITPFNIQDTQQGMILGTVVADETAESPTGWKYRSKNNFYKEYHSVTDGEDTEELRTIGVLVELSTDSMAKEQGAVWIKLAQHMQTVPEVGVTVSIGRSNDESEMPEIQSVVQSNGSKVVTPSEWQANTSVGSNVSTSYGDSKSIRFGLNSTVDLDKAIKVVENSYATGKYKDVSYSQGGGYSYSTAEGGKSGLLSESVTYGSTDSQFYAGYTNNHSEIDRSISTSEIGYSYSKSKIGSTDSYTTITGRSYSKTTVGEQESETTIHGLTSSSTTHNGDIYSTSKIYANQTSDSFTLGNTSSESTTIGWVNSFNTFLGVKTSIDLSASASISRTINASISDSFTLNAGLSHSILIDVGANVSTHVNGTAEIKNDIKMFQSNNKTTPLEVINEPANVKARIGNIDVEMMNFKIFM